MRATYRILAFIVCGLVVLQAASRAWASAGIDQHLAEGGTIDVESGARRRSRRRSASRSTG